MSQIDGSKAQNGVRILGLECLQGVEDIPGTVLQCSIHYTVFVQRKQTAGDSRRQEKMSSVAGSVVQVDQCRMFL